MLDISGELWSDGFLFCDTTVVCKLNTKSDSVIYFILIVIVVIVIIALKKSKNAKISESLFNEGGDNTTELVMNQILALKSGKYGDVETIHIHRMFSSFDKSPTPLIEIIASGENVNTNELKMDKFEISMKDNKVNATKQLQGINYSQWKNYYKDYIYAETHRKFQDNGNDLVVLKDDMLSILIGVKDVAMMVNS